LEGQETIFSFSEGSSRIAEEFLNHFDMFTKILENATNEKSISESMGHRRKFSTGAGGTRTLIPTKYKKEAIERVCISRLLSWFNTLLILESSEFNRAVKETEVLRHLVDLCELYDDHTLIQSECRKIFTTILNQDDMTMK
jgi:hypothetical protein